MPKYVYETIPTDGSAPERFEVKQPMADDAWTVHPDTGVAVKRVLTAPMLNTGARAASPSAAPSAPCRTACGCHSAKN
ncbi:MAG: zinc ribbon domain-containing protein [Deltaproteobacteria bacterium]|nr:zinc ribbon domain-containing protein [Deltaproteobacteria bacterium]